MSVCTGGGGVLHVRALCLCVPVLSSDEMFYNWEKKTGQFYFLSVIFYLLFSRVCVCLCVPVKGVSFFLQRNVYWYTGLWINGVLCTLYSLLTDAVELPRV